jgi:hypothetical protein
MPLAEKFEAAKKNADPEMEAYMESDAGREELESKLPKEPLVPKGKHALDEFEKKQKWNNNPLAEVKNEQIDQMLEGLRKQEKGPISDWEYERLKKKVKERRSSQAEI